MKRGFTLLESVIVMSLLGVVGLSFVYLFTTAQRFMIQSLNATSSQGDAAFALEHIKRHLTTATAVALPVTGTTDTVLQFTWQRTSAVVQQTSRYVLNGTDLRFIPDTANDGAFEVVSQGITTITFNRAVAGTISIDVTAQRTSGGDTRQMRLQTNVSPRGLFQ
jgi:prepilin-type N-terminal cleavage/methylation domain-containing protein